MTSTPSNGNSPVQSGADESVTGAAAPATDAPLDARCLILDGVSAWYGQAQALWDASITVDYGQFVGIVGRNGAGKSTMLRVISRVHARAEGGLRLFGEDILALRPEEVARRGLSMMREGGGIFETLSVEDHLMLAARLAGQRGQSSDVDEVWEWFPMLQERRDAKGGFLSGGQRKMLGLAMAFVSRPRCLLLDEPSAGLAESVTESVFLMVERLAGSNMTLVVSEQDPRWLSESDKMYELELGRVVNVTTPRTSSGHGGETVTSPS
jgi:ABC-type branched-subunit amino acid transport system ATPase component